MTSTRVQRLRPTFSYEDIGLGIYLSFATSVYIPRSSFYQRGGHTNESDLTTLKNGLLLQLTQSAFGRLIREHSKFKVSARTQLPVKRTLVKRAIFLFLNRSL